MARHILLDLFCPLLTLRGAVVDKALKDQADDSFFRVVCWEFWNFDEILGGLEYSSSHT